MRKKLAEMSSNSQPWNDQDVHQIWHRGESGRNQKEARIYVKRAEAKQITSVLEVQFSKS